MPSIKSSQVDNSFLTPFRNKIINGGYRVWQRGTNFSCAVNSNTFVADRWALTSNTNNAGTITVGQETSLVPDANTRYSLKITNAAGSDTSLSAQANTHLRYTMEGYHLVPLIGKVCTLSFWVRSSKTGTYCVRFANNANDRTYVAEYAVSAANTFEKKTVPITFDYSGGTWDYTNGVGLKVSFVLACGQDYKTTAGSWQAGNYLASSNQVNWLNDQSNTFYVSNVQLEVGPATDFEVRDYADELRMCQRYFRVVGPGLVGCASNTTIVDFGIVLSPEMRTTPSISPTAAITVIDTVTGTYTQSSPSATFLDSTSVNYRGSIIRLWNLSGMTTGRAVQYYSGGLIYMDAEMIGDIGAARSLRFNSADSSYLYRTPSVAGNRKTWTLSLWCKRSTLGTQQDIFSAGASTSDETMLSFSTSSDNVIRFFDWTSSAYRCHKVTTAEYRDPAAWYHIVVAVDTTQATASDRFKMYINGAQVTSFSTSIDYSQNADTFVNNTGAHDLGGRVDNSIRFNGYMSDVYLVDGLQLTPSSFGQTDSTTGQWVPISYGGAYGTCGFKLDFSDRSSTTALGYDKSGRLNNWNTSGFSIVDDKTQDSMVDLPTNNWCTLNLLKNSATVVNGALDGSNASASWLNVRATFGMTSGKWYWEATQTDSVTRAIGIATQECSLSSYLGYDALGWAIHSDTGNKYTNASGVAYGVSYTTNDVVGIAFDADSGKFYMSKNGTWMNSGDPVAGTGYAWTGLTNGPYFPAASFWTGGASFNFGQRSFAYTPPVGYKTLCAANLPTPVIVKSYQYFDVNLRTGTGATANITGKAFQPDFVWTKNRSTTNSHELMDSVRGVQKTLLSDWIGVEQNELQSLLSFNTDGFTVGTLVNVNGSGNAIVDWMWKKGALPGFDIIAFTAAASGQFAVNHSLGVAPDMVISKARSTSDYYWYSWHRALGDNTNDYINLNQTSGELTYSTMWGSIGRTSTQLGFTVGGSVPPSGLVIAYAFVSVPGFSKFGSYTGNGSADGPFVWTGMRPKYVMIKRTDTTGNWQILDGRRCSSSNGNPIDLPLYADVSDAEGSAYYRDFLSNGFKLRDTTAICNANGGTYIYAAFAESPFRYSNAR